MYRLLLMLPMLIVAPAWAATDTGIDAIFSTLADAKSPGMAVLVRKNGRTIFAHGYGVTDLNSFTNIDQTTDFRLASCTKQFTAMAIMLLVHDGKLRYDEPLTGVFTEFPAYGREITIRHLLTHTSGLPDYEDLMDSKWSEIHQIQDEEVLRLLEQHPNPKFAPGTSWAYSNSGYVILGLIVAKVSQKSFGDFLRERIFEPLAMDHTLVYVPGQNSVPNRAFGHSKKDGAFIQTDQSSTSATLGDGGVYSNADDLAKWDWALQHHALLSERDMSPALTSSNSASYGFGWFLDPYQGHARMWHSGSTMGFRTVIDRFTNDRLTVIILANRTDLDVDKLALQVADRLFTESSLIPRRASSSR